jgi:hypothetical protein
MKQLDWRTFLIGLAFISSTAFAMDTFYGDLGEADWTFVSEVLIDGVELPDDMTETTGTSSVEITGTGTMTVGNRSLGTDNLNVKVFGGTTIESERQWDAEDSLTWFEGIFPAPREGRKPSFGNIAYDDQGRHLGTQIHVLSVFGLGLSNEKFSFSTPAAFTFPARIPDTTKVWLAYKEDVTPSENEDAEWEIEEGDFCVVENGLCQIELEEFNEVALVQEYFQKCPRTSSSDTDVINGKISGPPECLVTCNRGYDLDYETMKCEPGEGTVVEPSVEEPVAEAAPVVEEEAKNPAYYRYVGAPRDRYLNDIEEEVVVEENKDAGLMEYLLHVRNFFGAGSSANVVRSEEAEINPDTEEGEEVYSSAPLLPQTGPGLFLGLAALGLGCMVVGAKGRRK